MGLDRRTLNLILILGFTVACEQPEVEVGMNQPGSGGEHGVTGTDAAVGAQSYPVAIGPRTNRSIFSGSFFTGGCEASEVVSGTAVASDRAICSSLSVVVNSTSFPVQVGSRTTRSIFNGSFFTGGCLADEVVSGISVPSDEAICSPLTVNIGSMVHTIQVGPRATRSVLQGGCQADEVVSGIAVSSDDAICSTLSLFLP
jgi:hypothetical protein